MAVDLDVPLAVLGVEPLQRLDLLLAQLDLPLPDRLLQPQKPVVAGQEVIARPDAPHAARTDLDPPEHQLVGDPLGPVCRVLQRVGQDRLFNRQGRPVRVRPPGARQPVEQPVGAVQLKAPPDLVELLAAVADDPARLRDVAELLGKL